MAKSTGIILTATAISFGNEWYNDGTPNFRIAVAGLGVALLFDGIEKVNEQIAVGLSAIVLITVLLTPIHKKTPIDTVNSWLKGK
jgi:hypothetical protein